MPHSRGNLLKCRDPSGSRAPAYATAAVMGAGFVFSMAMCWPGHLSYDSVVQLLEGRSGVYSGWHPPVMSWLLGLSDQLMPGAGLFMAVTALVFFLGLVSLLWLAPRPCWTGPAVAALCMLLPQIVLYQGIVWKDVLFANATVAGFVAQAHLGANWDRARRRAGLIVLSFLFLVFAALSRQNGAIVLLAGCVSLLGICRRQKETWRVAISGSLGALILSVLVMLAATAALNTRLPREAGLSQQVKRLQLYDLIGALAVDPALKFPVLEKGSPKLVRFMRSDGVRLYSPVRSDTLVRSASLQAALERTTKDALRSAWLNLIVHHRVDYLRARIGAFRWVTLTPKISLCVPYVVGVRGPPQTMNALGLRHRFNRRDQLADTYGQAFVRTPVFSHLTFLLLAFGELAFLISRRRPADIAMIGMLAGAIGYCASFFFVSLACDYRYCYALDLTAIAALVYLALDPAIRSKSAAARS